MVRRLLATSSLASLVAAGAMVGFGGGTPSVAFPACVTPSNGPYSNSGTINCVLVGGSTISPSTTFSGGISNSGTISSGVTGIFVGGVSIFSSGISNSGTISVTGSVGLGAISGVCAGFCGDGFGIGVESVSIFSGGISNSGTVSSNITGILVGSISTFSGGISNSGTISAIGGFSPGTTLAVGASIPTGGNGIEVNSVSVFSGGISNSGTISASGISTITDKIGSGSAQANFGAGIFVNNVLTFSGGISNSGTISASGAIVNPDRNDTILAVGSGSPLLGGAIVVRSVSSFSGGISNTGSITGGMGIVVQGASAVSIFDSGAITATGISVPGDFTIGSAPIAIDLIGNSPGNVLTLGPGYMIAGQVLGQGSDTFQLGGTGNGSFDLSTVGTQYAGFTTFNVVSGVWTVGNVDAQTQAWNVNGGTLAGTGTLPALNVNSGGTLEPGTIGVPGTFMTITGNLAFQSGAIYLVNISPTTASRANVGGAVTLNGAVLGLLLPGSYSGKTTYDILDPPSISGKFTGFTAINEPGFGGTLTYTPTDVLLNLTANLSGGFNQNQQNVAAGINNFFNNGGTLPADFFPLFGQTGNTLAGTLSQLDGEVATGADKAAFQLMTEFLTLMLDPTLGGGTGGSSSSAFAPEQQAELPPDVALAYASVLKAPPKPAALDQRWRAWGSGFGGSTTSNGDPAVGSSNIAARTYGFAAGMDYRFTPDTQVGFALAGAGTNWALAQTPGTGRSDALQAGVYGKTYLGPAYLAASLAFTNHWMNTNRIALGDQITASFNAQSYGARLETGYRYAVAPLLGVTPYAALQAQSFHTPSYSETDLGAGGFGLTYSAMNSTDARSELGLRTDSLTALNGMPLVLRGRLAWAHDWVSNPALGAVFQALPGASFVVNGAPLPPNSALASAAAELRVTANWSLMGKFDGEFATGSQTYAGTGTLRYAW